MQAVSGPTLMMAIQAMDAAMHRLNAECADTTGPELADLQELQLSYFKAAEELRKAYIEECRTALNLPPYEELLNP